MWGLTTMKGLNNYQESSVIFLNTVGILITNSTFEITTAIRQAIKLAFIYEAIHIKNVYENKRVNNE